MLIVEKKAEVFLFGSRSPFDELALKVISELKNKYPYIRRIYVRAQFPEIGDDYYNYLLNSYDDTFFPEGLLGAGKNAYIKRN